MGSLSDTVSSHRHRTHQAELGSGGAGNFFCRKNCLCTTTNQDRGLQLLQEIMNFTTFLHIHEVERYGLKPVRCSTYVQWWIIDVIWNCLVFLNVIVNLSKKQKHRDGKSVIFFLWVSAGFVCLQKWKKDQVSRSVARLALFLCVLVNLKERGGGGGLCGRRTRVREGLRALMCTRGSQKLVCI